MCLTWRRIQFFCRLKRFTLRRYFWTWLNHEFCRRVFAGVDVKLVTSPDDQRILTYSSGNPFAGAAAGLAFLAIGGFLIFLASNPEAASSFFKSGMAPAVGTWKNQLLSWAGVMMVGLGFYVGWTEGHTKIEIFPDRKCLKYKFHNFFRSKGAIVNFQEIDGCRIQRIGGNKIHSRPIFFVVIALENGDKLRTGQGSLEQNEVIDHAHELGRILEVPVSVGLIHYKIGSPIDVFGLKVNSAFFSLVFAILAYIFWYRATVGPLCTAMWFGGVPISLITTFWVTLTLWFRFRRI